MTKKETMKCPFCGEEIKEGAVKCRYCFNFLDGSEELKKVVKEGIDRKINNGKEKLIGLKPKVRRALIVAYFFITVPAMITLIVFIRINYASHFRYGTYYPRDRGKTIFFTVLIPILYIIITDILRGAAYYIDSGKYELAILNKIKALF